MATFQEAAISANQLLESGRLPEAESLFIQLVRANPNWGDGHAGLSRIFFLTGRIDLAVTALQAAITRNPSDLAACYSNLGVTLHEAKRFTEAVDAYRKAVALVPGYAVAHRNLGDALRELKQYENAEQSYVHAMKLDPAMGDAYAGVGQVRFYQKRYQEAAEQFQLALQQNPNDANATTNLILCHLHLGRHASLLDAVRGSIQLFPEDPLRHSGLLMFLNYLHGADLPVVFEESREFDRRHIQPLAATLRPHAACFEEGRPLRIGYISGDFYAHSVATFLEPVMRCHDHQHFQIYCYAEVETPDEVTARLQKLADVWRSTVGLSHDEVAAQIRTDGVDILIDLAGHSSGNRLPVLGRKPAPVQVTWLGYPNTTGVSTIDYRLTDSRADPPDADPYYSEKLIRLPDAFFVYQPPAQSPPVSPLPMLTAGHVTFGSFSNIIKITPMVARGWVQLLETVPTARLLIAGIDPAAQHDLSQLLDGVAEDRIEWVGRLDLEPYLQLHHRVDISLDPYPWTGHTTTCHSLWMGVPVVSLAGPTAVSRAGASIMGALGMESDWVAKSAEDYVRLAVQWAGRSQELSTLRSALRARLSTSVLMDSERFTRNLEAVLRELKPRQPFLQD